MIVNRRHLGFGVASKGGHMEESESSTDPRDVFVVHGRNLVARNALFAFLEALNLRRSNGRRLWIGPAGVPHISGTL